MKKLLLTLCLLLAYFSAYCQQTISGVVMDEEEKESQIGVTVQVKGTNIAVATDIDGRFTLPLKGIDNTDIIQFFYLGMETISISLEDLKSMDPIEIFLKKDIYSGMIRLITTRNGEKSAQTAYITSEKSLYFYETPEDTFLEEIILESKFEGLCVSINDLSTEGKEKRIVNENLWLFNITGDDNFYTTVIFSEPRKLPKNFMVSLDVGIIIVGLRWKPLSPVVIVR